MRLNRSQIYDRIVNEFEEKGCKLLTTKEEFYIYILFISFSFI